MKLIADDDWLANTLRVIVGDVCLRHDVPHDDRKTRAIIEDAALQGIKYLNVAYKNLVMEQHNDEIPK